MDKMSHHSTTKYRKKYQVVNGRRSREGRHICHYNTEFILLLILKEEQEICVSFPQGTVS
jgi:hypothetical protein